MKTQLYGEVDLLAERIGEFIQYWGFKKIHGKVWAHIFLSKEPMCSSELTERLGVSKALISQTVHELLEYEVIEQKEKNKRSCCYKSNLNLATVITAVLRKRERRLLSEIYTSYRNVSDMSDNQLSELNIDSERLNKLGKMIQFAEQFLGGILKLSDFKFIGLDKVFNLKNLTK